MDILQHIFGDFYGRMWWRLLDATQWTIYLSLTAFVGGGLIGLVVTIMKISPSVWLRRIATTYIWIFQSIPLLMLLFLLGLGIPTFFRINVAPWLAASIAMTLFTSAYISDVWRGSLESVPSGQWESGRALALGFGEILWFIITPQAVRIAIPPTVGFVVQIIKGTALCYIIDFNDLMRVGKAIANSQVDGAQPFIVYPMMAVVYFALCFPITQLSRWLERRMIGT